MKRLLCIPLFMLLAGCGDAPAPVNEAKRIERPKEADNDLKPPSRPAASDDAGKKLLAEVLAAHTGGQPDKLAALRECSFTRKGVQYLSAGQTPAEWSTALLWPDRYRLRIELGYGGGVKQVQTFASNPAAAWVRAGDEPAPKEPMDKEVALTLASQKNEDAISLLFILADPATVVTRAADDQNLLGLHVWTPGIEYARLRIDPKTKLLTRFTYNGREGTDQVMKELIFQEFKEYAGVKLGAKMAARAKGNLLAEWTELTVDTAKPDPKSFDGP
jgi:hypothetical protein